MNRFIIEIITLYDQQTKLKKQIILFIKYFDLWFNLSFMIDLEKRDLTVKFTCYVRSRDIINIQYSKELPATNTNCEREETDFH